MKCGVKVSVYCLISKRSHSLRYVIKMYVFFPTLEHIS